MTAFQEQSEGSQERTGLIILCLLRVLSLGCHKWEEFLVKSNKFTFTYSTEGCHLLPKCLLMNALILFSFVKMIPIHLGIPPGVKHVTLTPQPSCKEGPLVEGGVGNVVWWSSHSAIRLRGFEAWL